MKKTFAAVLVVLVSFAAACDNSMTGPSGSMSMAGTWAGSASDSSGSMGTGSRMGQTGMGTMTWPLTQRGSTVTGTMNFSGSGMQGRTPGAFSGVMTGDDMTFTMDMAVGSMMAAGCSSRATGTGRVNRTTMIMTGTYVGMNSCTGAYTNGQMTMTRR